MSRDKLVDKFDECFGISTATEAQRKKFFDWVMAQQQSAQQNAHLTLGSPPVFCVCCGGEVSHPVCVNCLPSPAQVKRKPLANPKGK